jgi:hypothetical protein
MGCLSRAPNRHAETNRQTSLGLAVFVYPQIGQIEE